jgi:hypothetical protein
VEREHGQLDLLVNSSWAGKFMSEWSRRLRNLSDLFWQETMATIQNFWLTSVDAARLMSRQHSGLILA